MNRDLEGYILLDEKDLDFWAGYLNDWQAEARAQLRNGVYRQKTTEVHKIRLEIRDGKITGELLH